MRLVDENGQANQGRVEVFYNGAWGTVCDDKFDRNAAAVVCTRMGYERYNCMVMLTFVHRGNVVWPCLSLYKDVKLYGCVYLFTKGTVVWMCIPLYKMYRCISVHTFVQKGRVVWLCIPLYEK